MIDFHSAARRSTMLRVKPASSLNSEFDSRILRVSVGEGGVTRPQFTQDGVFQKIYCLHCGRPAGAVTAEIPPALRGDPGVIYVCDECDAKLGTLPGHAISFERRRES